MGIVKIAHGVKMVQQILSCAVGFHLKMDNRFNAQLVGRIIGGLSFAGTCLTGNQQGFAHSNRCIDSRLQRFARDEMPGIFGKRISGAAVRPVA